MLHFPWLVNILWAFPLFWLWHLDNQLYTPQHYIVNGYKKHQLKATDSLILICTVAAWQSPPCSKRGFFPLPTIDLMCQAGSTGLPSQTFFKALNSCKFIGSCEWPLREILLQDTKFLLDLLLSLLDQNFYKLRYIKLCSISQNVNASLYTVCANIFWGPNKFPHLLAPRPSLY